MTVITERISRASPPTPRPGPPTYDDGRPALPHEHLLVPRFPRFQSSHPDVRRAVAAGEADFVGAGGAIGLFAEIDEEAVVELQSALGRVAVELQEVRAFL